MDVQFLTTCRTIIVLSVLLCIGCAQRGAKQDDDTSTRKEPGPRSQGIAGPIRLELKLTPGRVEKSKFESVVQTRRFEKGQLLAERVETTDFATKLTHVSSQGPTGPFLYRAKTISKDGMAELHDLAFPELGESIDLLVSPQGDVLSAGIYPKESIFYVPSLSLPTTPVQVGDTWSLQRRWYSLKGGLPMQFDIVSIFKNVFACGKSVCAEIEVSGTVGVAPADPKAPAQLTSVASMVSDLRGRYLFDVQSGTVLWSHILNTERLVSGDWKIDVRSCIVEALDEPAAEKWSWYKQVKCDPLADAPAHIPGL
jgi:hypothetical protein